MICQEPLEENMFIRFFLFSSDDSSVKQTWKISGCVMAEVAVLILTLSTEVLIYFSEREILDMEVGF